ncbi:MAG: hypothetical protein HZB16_15000 [Armatimonadetes bacterium]|nr:hypothetical protein [Armatimonadota bacterium]
MKCTGVVLVACLLTVACAVEVDPVRVNLRVAEPHQTMDNFGASGGWWADPIGSAWGEPAKERVAELLFSPERGIGLSAWRFNIGAGSLYSGDNVWDKWRAVECFKKTADEPYAWSRHAGQQWFLRAAARYGVRDRVAFACSPPIWLTKNGRGQCDPNVGSTNLRPGADADYARFLCDVLTHFARQGLPFTHLSPLNEPQWEWNGGQEGCRYNNEDMIRLLRALGAEVKAQGLDVVVDLLDAGEWVFLLDDEDWRQWAHKPAPTAYVHANGTKGWGKYRGYIGDLLGDPELRGILGNRLSAHSYWTDNGRDRLVDLRRAVRADADRVSPGAKLQMTEFCVMQHKRDLGMDTALHVARTIHSDLAWAEVSAWHWWLALSPHDYKDGLLYTDWRETGKETVLTSKTFWALGNWSRYVRPGWRRVAADPVDQGDLCVTAFTSPAADKLAMVVVNESRDGQRLWLDSDKPLRNLRLAVTSADHDLAELPQHGDVVEVPARSVVTVLADL